MVLKPPTSRVCDGRVHVDINDVETRGRGRVHSRGMFCNRCRFCVRNDLDFFIWVELGVGEMDSRAKLKTGVDAFWKPL